MTSNYDSLMWDCTCGESGDWGSPCSNGHQYNPREDTRCWECGWCSTHNGMRRDTCHQCGKKYVGPYEGGCFPAGSRIHTPSGPRCIATIMEGDEVLSARTGKLVAERVKRVVRHEPAAIASLHFVCGRRLKVTRQHTMLTPHGWQRIRDLLPGHELMLVSGKTATLQTIEAAGRAPVYNLITTGAHTFVADEFVAHNFTTLRVVRTIMHQCLLDWHYNLRRPRHTNAIVHA